MARPCPNQVETSTGWYCPEVMRLRDGLARVKEENKRLKDENRRLKKMYADLALDNQILRDVIEKKL